MARRKVIHWVSTGAVVTTVGAVAGIPISFDFSSAAVSPDELASDNCCIDVEAHILGYSTAGTANLALNRIISASFRRVAGTLTELGADTVLANKSDAGLAAAVTNVALNANVVRVDVTGVAAITIDWFADMRIRIYQPA